MIWKDASGKFKVEARYISRTDSDVTIRKTDGTEATVPIDALHPTLRQLVGKTTVTSELNKIDGAIPIRVGDPVQVKSWSSWYDGVVQEVKIGGAEVEYTRGSWGKKNEYFDLKDIRYPNGEGPWREWSDASGGFKIIARYLARNETHVTILKEDQTELDVPIDRLSAPIKRLLKQTPIIARRPPLVTLAGAELLGDEEDLSPSQRMLTSRSRARNAAAAAPDLATVSIQIGTPVSQQTLRLPQAGLAFPIEPKSTIGEVVPIGGSDGWVAISTEGDRWSPELLTTLYWANLSKRTSLAGPRFFPDQRFISYSPHQRRAVMYSVKGTWNEPYQISTYRVSPGEKSAQPEITLDIPQKKHSFNREPIRVELVGDDLMLFGYAGKISLWNLDERRVMYEVGDLSSHNFRLSIDHRYFAVRRPEQHHQSL